MRMFHGLLVLVIGLAGCSGDRASRRSAGSASPKRSVTETTFKPNGYSKTNNPTTAAGRGEPSLEDAQRPAAWVFIDGAPGQFTERDGQKLIQWTIDQPASDAPTFRVEGFEPLIGGARDFKCVLRAVDSTEGTDFMYGIAAKPGTFQTGKDYSLLNPGGNFVIRNGWTGDVVLEVAPLAPGAYAIAAGLENAKTGKKAAAVTYFTVGGGK